MGIIVKLLFLKKIKNKQLMLKLCKSLRTTSLGQNLLPVLIKKRVVTQNKAQVAPCLYAEDEQRSYVNRNRSINFSSSSVWNLRAQIISSTFSLQVSLTDPLSDKLPKTVEEEL